MKNKLLIHILSIICLFSTVFASETHANQLPYNYEDTDFYIIKLSPLKTISTKKDVSENEIIQLKVQEDVFIDNQKIISKDEIINAKIETIVQPGYAGLPAEIMIDNFEIQNVKKSQLISEYTKKGNFRWWYRFFKLAIPPPISFFIPLGRFVKGGHAKIKPKDIIEIKYFPNWK